jgi:hypothetical protein
MWGILFREKISGVLIGILKIWNLILPEMPVFRGLKPERQSQILFMRFWKVICKISVRNPLLQNQTNSKTDFEYQSIPSSSIILSNNTFFLFYSFLFYLFSPFFSSIL